MAILLYCVAEAHLPVEGVLTGVAQLPVLRLEGHDLATFASQNTNSDVWRKRPLEQAALEFHQVLRELFRSMAIIPFRFPTILAEEQDWHAHLEQHAREYKVWLEKFRTCVQLEVLISAPNASGERSAASGKAYLEERRRRTEALERVASEVQREAGLAVKQWRTRFIEEGLRCFALVERKLSGSFKSAVARVPLPPGCKLRTSGPWPAAEFLKLG